MDINDRRDSGDRRRGSIFNGSLPFLTKDGLVFHDRRSQSDRRADECRQRERRNGKQSASKLN